MTFKVGTKHAVTVIDVNGVPVTFQPQRLARVNRPGSEQGTFESEGHQFPRFEATVTGISGLPAPEPDVYWIVSAETAREGRHIRNDLVAPYRFVREKNANTGANEVVACYGLMYFTSPDPAADPPNGRARGRGRSKGTPATSGPALRTPAEQVDPHWTHYGFEEDPGPTQEELDAREAELDAQYEVWAEVDAQAEWVQEHLASRSEGVGLEER